jgi:oligopeptide/dipeptide ABC transporter ATP-binding protein
LLAVRALSIAFGATEIVRGVDFAIAPGEAVGLVGESGSGKSLTALGVMRLLPRGARISGGEVSWRGRPLTGLPESALRGLRGREVAMVFQDPLSALNPAFTIGRQIVDALRAHQPMRRATADARAAELLEAVGIAEPVRRLAAYPHEFSGGMRQRVAIAIAIAGGPKLLIADEPTTALDVTVQAQVVELLGRLRRELGLGLLFISHNLDLVAGMCDRIVVMYAGRVAEADTAEALFTAPRHPYTRQLLRCIPRLDDAAGLLPTIPGAPPQAGRFPAGCAFAPRCDLATDRCRAEMPQPAGTPPRQVACWMAPP